MSIKHVAFQAFNLSRKVASATGLARPARAILGPSVGKILYRLAAKSDAPVSVNGHTMYLATKGKYPPLRMALGQYEEDTTRLFTECIKSGMTVLDIGAHVGYYSLLAAKLSGSGGRVISFEPDPDNYSLLVKNISENGYETITAVNKGVAANSGAGTLYISRLDNGRHSTYRDNAPSNNSISITTTSIDDFFSALEWPTVDLVKVDVEGAEMDVLNGMTGLLERCPNIRLVMELNPVLLKKAGVDPQAMMASLESQGFTLHQLMPEDEPAVLKSSDSGRLIAGLLANQDSINLYCTR
jgi:FkbM family methyltransferase